MAYQGRGSKTANKIISKDIKAKGGKAKAAVAITKEAAKTAALLYGPGKAAKVATKTGKAAQTLVRGKRTYYHGSPNEIPLGSTLKTKAQGSKLDPRAGKSSGTTKKKVAESFATGRLAMVDGKLQKGSGYVYKVKSKSGDVTKVGGGNKEFAAKDFIVVKQIKKVKKK